LRSGVAPLNAFEKRGINTAIGLDEAGINDDRDMLQEMRMVLRAHRVPGTEYEDVPEPWPSPAHGDRWRCRDHTLRRPYRHARSRQGSRSRIARLG
jgi:hypothetical protein